MKKDKIKHGKGLMNDSEKLLKGLLESCQIYHAPMFASVIITGIHNGTEYDNIVYSAQSHMVKLTEDKIRKHMLIANGFEAIGGSAIIDDIQESDTCGNEDKIPDVVKNRATTIYRLDDTSIKDIKQKVEGIVAMAKQNDTSAFVSVAVANTENDTEYITEYYVPKSQIRLKDNQIEKHVLISEKSFDAIPKRDAVSFDMEEVFGDYE